MLETVTLVMFEATFAIAMNDFKNITDGCRKLCNV